MNTQFSYSQKLVLTIIMVIIVHLQIKSQNTTINKVIFIKSNGFGIVNNPANENRDVKPAENEEQKERDFFVNTRSQIEGKIKRSTPSLQKRTVGEDYFSAKIIKNFNGLSTPSDPTDANGDVNENYYVQVVNSNIGIYNKNQSSLINSFPINNIYNSQLPGANYQIIDPIVLWDENAMRWIVVGFSSSGSSYYIMIALSTSENPNSSWFSWSIASTVQPDYPKIGVWRDGYYLGVNANNRGNDVFVLNRDDILAGLSSIRIVSLSSAGIRPQITGNEFMCLLPLDNDGPFAPQGTKEMFLAVSDDGKGNPSDALYFYECNIDWVTPLNSSLTLATTLPVDSFDGIFNGVIPQPNSQGGFVPSTSVLMHRVQYRIINGIPKIVCNHTVKVADNQVGIRWYELQNSGGGWNIRQQATYNPGILGDSRWNASIAMNETGGIMMGYSISGSSTYAGIRCCGHSPNGALGVMDVNETEVVTGSTSAGSSGQYGDYSCMTIDPSDQNLFWFTSEYKDIASSQDSKKNTRIASLRLGVYSSQKYNNWNNDLSNVENHKSFSISNETAELRSNFNSTQFGIVIKNNLEQTSVTGGNIDFKDPWLIDYADSVYGNNLRNRGMNAPFKSRTAPFYPDATTSYSGDVYKGVFLNQNPQFQQGIPSYSVKASQTQNINLGSPQGTRTFYFQNWSGTEVQFENASAIQIPPQIIIQHIFLAGKRMGQVSKLLIITYPTLI